MIEPPYRWIYAGLATAILGNVAAVWVLIDSGIYIFAGNVSAILVCAMVAFVIRLRQKGRMSAEPNARGDGDG